MTDDAADDDDERLKSLRAVWLSMPDEDPPERGLADLMAAARMKADEMAAKAEPATPSLWKRFLELMRRPPVLALATVTVLIGGAALVGRRGESIESSPTVAPTQSAPESMSESTVTTTPSAPPPAEPAAAPAHGSAMEMRADDSIAPGGAEGGDDEATRGVVGGAVETKGGAPTRRTAPKHNAKRELQSPPPVEEKKAPEGRAPLADRPIEQTQAFDDGDLAKDDEAPKKTRSPTTESPKESAKASGATAIPTIKADTADGTSVIELHQMARQAAARGDCAAMTRAVRKIAAKDAHYYDQKVASDPALASCLKK